MPYEWTDEGLEAESTQQVGGQVQIRTLTLVLEPMARQT